MFSGVIVLGTGQRFVPSRDGLCSLVWKGRGLSAISSMDVPLALKLCFWEGSLGNTEC